jgi:hypothetical protein
MAIYVQEAGEGPPTVDRGTLASVVVHHTDRGCPQPGVAD